MDVTNFILIDSTLESQVSVFRRNDIFEGWLQTFNDIPQALDFIFGINVSDSIEVYLARDDIFSDGRPSATNGQMRNLLQTLENLETIHHINVYSPNVDNDLRIQVRAMLSNTRVLKHVLCVINLHDLMCSDFEFYFKQQITKFRHRQQLHLINSFLRKLEDLEGYRRRLDDNLRQQVQPEIDQHGDRPGVQET